MELTGTGNIYKGYGGTQYFKNWWIISVKTVLLGHGIASLLLFRSKAPQLLKIENCDEDMDVSHIAKTLMNECADRPPNMDTCNCRLSVEKTPKYVALYCSSFLEKCLLSSNTHQLPF